MILRLITALVTAADFFKLQNNFHDIETRFTRFRFEPQETPKNPILGETYLDSTTKKIRTWDGEIWRDHY